MSDAGVPGAILAVQTKDGVWIGAAGKADLDTNVPMTPDMQVRIGGVTKVFTAALIMKLVEENKIALTDTVEKWLPALIAPGTVPYSDQITVAMLLNHTSGLYDYVGDQYFTDLMLSDPYYAWPSDSTYDESHLLDVTTPISSRERQLSIATPVTTSWGRLPKQPPGTRTPWRTWLKPVSSIP